MVHYYNTTLLADYMPSFIYHIKPSVPQSPPTPLAKKLDVEKVLDDIETALRSARPNIFK
jgi:hypothetical protein